ncbi:MAG: HipA N-terminal domain-containing protein [Bacteroidetes bacterium]|nr:HipA N-terminal domain-containing protein [Bacteroidota bacterium]
MRKALVFYKGEEAGILTQADDGKFVFEYHDNWLTDSYKPSISLTLPKNQQIHHQDQIFPFFFNMLPEGNNKRLVCNLLRIDEDDYFGLLLATARFDTIGAVTVEKIPA